MINLRNQIASHYLHIAHYYLKWGAYLAAANRAYKIIEDLPETPAVTGALEVIAKAYNKLGMHDFEQNIVDLMNNLKNRDNHLESVTKK